MVLVMKNESFLIEFVPFFLSSIFHAIHKHLFYIHSICPMSAVETMINDRQLVVSRRLSYFLSIKKILLIEGWLFYNIVLIFARYQHVNHRHSYVAPILNLPPISHSIQPLQVVIEHLIEGSYL